jgi:thiol:disulfide interchange protein
MVKLALRISSENLSEEPPNAPHDAPRSESRAPEYSIWQMPQGYNLSQDTTNLILNPTQHQYPPSAWGDAARHLDAFLHVQRIGLAHLTGSNPHNNSKHTCCQTKHESCKNNKATKQAPPAKRHPTRQQPPNQMRAPTNNKPTRNKKQPKRL